MKNLKRRLTAMVLVLMLLAQMIPMASVSAADYNLASDRAYTWLKNMQDRLNGTAMDGLVDSFEDTGNREYIVFTYDQAIAAIAFMLKNDRVRAERVLNQMAAIQDPDGSWINSYYWWGSGEEIRKHVGPLAFVVMAYMAYEKKYSDTRYQASAKKALDWAIKFRKPNGGISGGMTTWDVKVPWGQPAIWSEDVWTSTEHNEDMYNILQYYATKFPDRTTEYNNVATGVKSFLDTVVWDDTKNRFYGGYKHVAGHIDVAVPMDVNPWGVLALGTNGTKPYAASLNYIDNSVTAQGTLEDPRYVQTLEYPVGSGNFITAYDFDWDDSGATAYIDNDPNRPNGTLSADLWFEGTAFMSAAHYLNGNVNKANSILDEMIKRQVTSGPSLGGLPYSLNGTNNSYWKMASENCISSTGWLILAIHRFNPFTGSYINPVIPEIDIPTVPTGLTSQDNDIEPTSIRFTWTASTDNVGVTGYDVYRNGTFVGTVTGTTTTYMATGLMPNTTYSFTVKARDAAGNTSAASSALNVTTKPAPSDPTPPTQPTNLAGKNITTTSIALTWTASTDNVGVTEYVVYRDGTRIGRTATPNFDVTGLTANSTYAFRVEAEDAAGNVSVSSATKELTTLAIPDIIAPTAPTSLISPSKTNTTVNLSWTASTDNVGVEDYDVYRNGNIVGTTNTTTFTDTGLSPNTTYTYTVKAKDAARNVSAASGALNVTTPSSADFTQGVTYVNTTDSKIWFASNVNSTFVHVHYKVNGGIQQNLVMTKNMGTGQWEKTVTGLSSGDNIEYFFTYEKSSLAYDTAMFEQRHGIALDLIAPSTPAGLNSPSKTTNTINLSWTASTDNVAVAGYEIYIGNDVEKVSNVTSTTVAGLTPNTTYNIYIKAIDTSGNLSAASGSINVTTNSADIIAPSVPTNLASPSKTSNTVSLSWTASTDNVGVTSYDVYRGDEIVGSATGTSIIVANLSPNQSYSFTVRAKDAAGNISGASNALNVTTNPSSFSPTLFVRDGASSGVQGTLSMTAGAGANTDTISTAGGTNYDGNVHTPNVYVISGLTGAYDSSKATMFDLYLDSATSAGNGIQVRVSYDFTGDGTYDRLETYNYFATNNLVGLENYMQSHGIKSQSGSWANLSNGKVRIEVWSALGTGTSTIRTDATSANGSQSKIVIPFN